MGKLCIYQLVKRYPDVIDQYVVESIYMRKKQFIFNQKRRIWHVKNNETLKGWARNRGVEI